ncbi:MAG TPA: tetratricopeptide repeat protein [Pirellulales bacterium]|jgi:Tfp pilus assembly protein PilF|nr:tetratricopeptide repeat protein [Pirellulales bacterium]
MARFDKLEFGEKVTDSAPRLAKPGPGEGQKSWLEIADRQRRSGQYENALRHYSRALEDDKTLVTGWLGQVQMLVQLGEWPEAELWARKALELFPSHGDLLAGRAGALCRQGDPSQALAVCDGAMKQPGVSAYRWLVRGEIMVATRRDADRHCFDKAQQLDSDWLVGLESSLVYLHYRQPSKALDRVRRAVERAPDQYHLWYVQGSCQSKAGLDQAARQSFQRCLELCPRHVEAERELAALDSRGWSLGGLLRRLRGR